MAENANEDIYAATGGASITPDDDDFLEPTARSLWVGGTGNIAVVTTDGSELTFAAVPVGVFPVQCRKVKSTGTTATNIIALY